MIILASASPRRREILSQICTFEVRPPDCDESCDKCGGTREVSHAWDGGKVTTAATCGKGGSLQFPLKIHSAQRMTVAVVGRFNTHQQRGIGIHTVAGVIAHTIGHHHILLAGGAHDYTTGAHTKGIYASSCRRVIR